ncbi:hypothetical protein G6011_05130 [Alternaria panax]|uniref:Opioid growth factor receptor (OGFr) conserved domain-containing protein n=1 Tax=Alternaria panax TaxID=48097 RepID=A0AAD4I8V6_9PLEO|nr:hypothetical protein G6011_05130 [Alternaria panax]
MDRALDHKEQEKVCTLRADFHNTLKRKISNPPTSTPADSAHSSSTTQPGRPRQDHERRNTCSTSAFSKKRFRMGLTKASKDEQASANEKSKVIIHFYDPDVYAKDALNRQLHQILAWPDQQLESTHNYIQMLFPLPEGSPFNMEAPVISLEVMQAFRSRSELRQGLRLSFERMLSFYGFKVSTKSEAELQKEKDEIKTSEFESASLGAADPLLASVLDAKLQKTVDVGHSTPATRAAAEVSITNPYIDLPIEEDKSVWKGKGSAPRTDESYAPTSSFPPGVHTNYPVSSPLTYHVVRAPGWRKRFANWAVKFNHNHLRITRILRCLRVLGLQTEYTAFFAALERTYNDPNISISDRSMGFWRLAVTNPLHLAPDGEKCKWLIGWEKEQESLVRGNEERLRNERDSIQKKKWVKFDKDLKKFDDDLEG